MIIKFEVSIANRFHKPCVYSDSDISHKIFYDRFLMIRIYVEVHGGDVK